MDQEPENQLRELRAYVAARGWTAMEFVDRGVSGSKDKRPALDELLKAAKRRKFDVLVCWRLDRLGRNLRHLILLLGELQALGVAFVSLAEGIDATTPAGRLQLQRAGCDRGVRAGPHPRASHGGAAAGQGARYAIGETSDPSSHDARSWGHRPVGGVGVGCLEDDGGAMD
jgi:hypothetical protein